MLVLTTTTMVRITTRILVETTMQEIISILRIATMVSKDKIDNGTPVQKMEVYLLITTIMLSLWTSINMTMIRMYLMMMAHISMEIKK